MLSREELECICSEEGCPVAPWEWEQGLEHGLRAAFDEAHLSKALAVTLAQTPLLARCQRLEEALRQIVDKPEGAYSRDPVKYRDNVIAWIQDMARAALEQ